MTMEPTTVMAEMALVSDINGVCNSGDTRRMISSPRNVASTNTYKYCRMSESIAYLLISYLTPLLRFAVVLRRQE